MGVRQPGSGVRKLDAAIRSAAFEVLPRGFTQKVRAYRRRNSFREAGVVMIHVPRTAGTSMSEALYGRFIGHFTLADLLAVGPDDVLALPRFAVARNPWSRLVSAWFKVLQADTHSLKRQRAAIPKVRAEDPTAADFDRFVHEWLVDQDFRGLDLVFQPQSDFLTDRSGCIALQHLGRYESLTETVVWLSDTVNRKIDLPHLNAGSHGRYRSLYTDGCRDTVAKVYARDIELLGYDF